MVGRLRAKVDIPLLLMGYANPLHAMGPVPFAESAAAVGVDGIIIPDLPPEEGEPFYKECRRRGIDPVLLAAPTSTPRRLAMLVEKTRGFLYYVSLQGVTGERSELSLDVEEKVRAIKALGDIPLCVGFGISTPAQSESVGRWADGVVVGSAFVRLIEEAGSVAEAVDHVAKLVAELKAPLR